MHVVKDKVNFVSEGKEWGEVGAWERSITAIKSSCGCTPDPGEGKDDPGDQHAWGCSGAISSSYQDLSLS